MIVILRRRQLVLVALAVCTLCALYRFGIPASEPAFAPTAARPRVIVIDAGHGGEDGGAVAADGTVESGVNLAVAQKLDALLRFLGEDTLLTRTDERALYSDDAQTLRQKKISDLQNRVALVNAQENALLVSIHQNSLPTNTRVHGAQAFYGRQQGSDTLARSVQAQLNAAVNGENAKTEKAMDDSIYLIKNVACPSILIECGFLSNPVETALLQTPTHQLMLAAAIAAGLLQQEGETL